MSGTKRAHITLSIVCADDDHFKCSHNLKATQLKKIIKICRWTYVLGKAKSNCCDDYFKCPKIKLRQGQERGPVSGSAKAVLTRGTVAISNKSDLDVVGISKSWDIAALIAHVLAAVTNPIQCIQQFMIKHHDDYQNSWRIARRAFQSSWISNLVTYLVFFWWKCSGRGRTQRSQMRSSAPLASRMPSIQGASDPKTIPMSPATENWSSTS